MQMNINELPYAGYNEELTPQTKIKNRKTLDATTGQRNAENSMCSRYFKFLGANESSHKENYRIPIHFLQNTDELNLNRYLEGYSAFAYTSVSSSS